METIHLDQNIQVLCVTASSFPNGVKQAFDDLNQALPFMEERTVFGISSPNQKQEIIYMAAASVLPGDNGATYGCDEYTIRKGAYAAETITNWQQRMNEFGPTFQRLLANPKLDHTSRCIEWYKGDDVLCMVGVTAG